MKSKNHQPKRGFTLVELLITITIISVLTTVSVVGYVSFINKANEARDQAMVDQLNRLKQAYEVENGKEITDEELSELLTGSGISFDDASPTSDGQKLYYDRESNTFVLGDADNPEGKDHLTEISEELLNGNTTTSSGGEEGTSQEPADEPVENTVTFTTNDEYSKTGNRDTGINVENSKINIKFYYDVDDKKSKIYPEFNPDDIITATDNTGAELEISYTINEIYVFTYPIQEEESVTSYSKKENGNIVFNKAGVYRLTCTANGVEKEGGIDIQVTNLYYNKDNDALVYFNNSYSKNPILISRNGINYTVQNVKCKNISVSDYDFQYQTYNNQAITDFSTMPKVLLVINLNEAEKEIPIVDGSPYSFEFDSEATECTIKLKYLGANGVIVYSDPKTVTISEK